MAYKRIHKAQMDVTMSPTKLRMNLLGSHGGGNKGEGAGIGKSPRASPSKLDDDDHPKNSLLPQELDDEYPKDRSDSSPSRSDASHGRAGGHNSGGGDSGKENGSGGGDSGKENGSGGGVGAGFEFPLKEATRGPFFRQQVQVPSKWNDAEKWIAGRRHVVRSNPMFSKKPAASASKGDSDTSSRARGAVGAVTTELSSFKSSSPASVSGPPPPKKLRTAAAASVSVSTRDVGTEMTPVASQAQSRSGTPAGAATPSLLSPRSGAPSASASFSASEREQELRLRTRREIAALGLQLGKMSIASWASKEDGLLAQPGAVDDEIKTKEFQARAVAWEEARKCKLAARYQKKEAKIHEWETCQKLKFEAKLKQTEAKAERLRARAKQDMAKRLSVLSHKVEGKQARVEARRSRQTARLARQVEQIRKTGRAPSRFRRCCAWFL